MSRESLKDFLQSKLGLDKDSISYNVATKDDLGSQTSESVRVERGDDLTYDPVTGKKLIDPNDGMLGQYLKHVTDPENQYKLQNNNQIVGSYRRGQSLTHAHHDSFVVQGTQEDAIMQTYSNSGYLETADFRIRDYLNKTGPNDKSSHELLFGIKGQNKSISNKVIIGSNEDSPVLDSVNEYLKRNNRFPAGNEAFIGDNINVEDFDSDQKQGTHTIQTDFGLYNKDSKNIAFYDSLRKVGASMLLKAGGWDISETPGGSIDPDNTSLKVVTSPIIEASVSSMESKNASGAISDEQGESVISFRDKKLETRDKAQSTYYNDEFRFENIKSQKLLKAKTIIALYALKERCKTILSGLSDIASGKYNGPGPFEYGESREKASSVISFIDSQIFVYTKYGYNKSFNTGIKILFGLNTENQLDLSSYNSTGYIDQTSSYWISVAHSFLRKIENTNFNKIEEDSAGENLYSQLKTLKEEKVIGFMNTVAIIGDIFLRTSGGKGTLNATESTTYMFDVDGLKDEPGSRVSKGRMKSGLTSLESSISVRSMPSMYLLPGNVINSSIDLDNLFTGQNPARGMLGSTLVDKTYFGAGMDTSFNRIPIDTVKELEDRLDAEYMPFYIQDLRTNEVISFHGFVTKINDGFQTDYESAKGYGRMDSVHTLKGTERTVSVDFKMIATNKQDFDEMWFKINKLTTLIYPQYTQGETISIGTSNYIQPFSQVVGATPVVRLRVGDVIKSNYSRDNLARLFGSGDKGMNLSKPEVDAVSSSGLAKIASIAKNLAKGAYRDYLMFAFYSLYGSPTALIQSIISAKGKSNALSVVDDISKQFLVNGFANPLGVGLVLDQLKSPDTPDQERPANTTNDSLGSLLKLGKLSELTSGGLFTGGENGYSKLQIVKISPSKGAPYRFIDREDNEKEIYVTKELDGLIIGKKRKDRESQTVATKTRSLQKEFKRNKRTNYNPERTVYEVFLLDVSGDTSLVGGKFLIYHEDIIPNYSSIFTTRVAPLIAIADPGSALRSASKTLASKAAASVGLSSDKATDLVANQFKDSQASFMLPDNNPVVKAFETNMGRGLAGVLDGFSFDWLNEDYAWESTYNARAPKGVDISLTLKVIHDIPPGMDHSGFNRAPLYNVGSIMEHVTDDPNRRHDRAKAYHSKHHEGKTKYFKDNK